MQLSTTGRDPPGISLPSFIIQIVCFFQEHQLLADKERAWEQDRKVKPFKIKE